MKKIVTFLFCGVMAVMASGWTEIQLKKFYIAPENLHVQNQSMFIFTGEAWQQVSAVYSDTDGLFVERVPEEEGWYCERCIGYHKQDDQCPRQ